MVVFITGQSKTMLGGVNPPTELGAIPCAISWLYKGINDRSLNYFNDSVLKLLVLRSLM